MDNGSGLSAVVKAIRQATVFVVTSHIGHDGDSLCSQLALYMVLNRLGKTVSVIDRDEVPGTYQFLPHSGVVRQERRLTEPCDVVFVLDASRLERTGLDFVPVRSGITLVNVDHHASNDLFGDVNWVDRGAPATSVLIYQLARKLEMAIDTDLATCLFTGLMTDTGYFRHSNATPETFLLAAELIAAGAPHSELHRRIYDERSLSEMRMMGQALAELKASQDQRIVWIEVTPRTFEPVKISNGHAGQIASNLCSIRGVDVGLTFEQNGESQTLVEIRSRGRVDVGAIAKNLGGGGHRNASGCTLNLPLSRARTLVLEEVRRAIDQSEAACPLTSTTEHGARRATL